MNKIFQDSSYVLISSLVSLGVSLGASILIARLLGPEGKGVITLVMQIAGLGSTLLTFGLSLAYQYYLGKNEIKLDEVIGHILIQSLIVTLLVVIFINIGGDNLLLQISKQALSHTLIIIAMVLLILETISAYINGPLMALYNGVKQNSLFAIMSTLLYGLGLVTFTWILGWGVVGVVVAYITGVFVRIIFSWNKIFTSAHKTITLNWFKLSKPLFIYGSSMMVGQFLLVSVFRIDTFLVNLYLDSGALGIYSIAFTFAELLLLIPRSFGVAIFPRMNKSVLNDKVSMMLKTAKINLILVVFGACIMLLGGYPIIKLLYGAKFESAFLALVWLLPGVIAMSLTYSSYHYFFSSTGRPYILAATYGLGILVNIVCNLILIPVMGINGAALSSSITYIIITITFILVISKQTKLSIRKIVIPGLEDIRVLFSAFTKLIIRLKEFQKLHSAPD